MQQLEPALALFRYHRTHTWPGRSEVVEGDGSVELVVRVGTKADPAVVIVRVRKWLERPMVVIARHVGNDAILPISGLSDPKVLAKLGGTLVQVGNLVDQIIGLGASNGPAS